MNFHNVCLASIAHNVDGQILSSKKLEENLSPLYQRLKLPEGRLSLMTGITQRRFWEPGTTPSSIAKTAAQRALQKSSIKKDQIDLLIHSSVCRDCLEPSTASIIHNLLGLSSHCQVFDLSNACLGMLNAVSLAAQMIEGGQIKNALIVSGENSGPLLQHTQSRLLNDESITRKSSKKFFANLTIGSAGVAVILSRKENFPLAPTLLGGATKTDSSANHLCRGEGNLFEMTMETNSEKLLEVGIPLAQTTFLQFKKNLKINRDQINWIISHQVGVAHEQAVLSALELLETPSYKSYPLYGNTGSAALFLTLSLMLEDKNIKIKNNDFMALLGIGSGLVSLMLGLKWPEKI